MPRGLLAGSTDYSHQTFRDILDDLNEWKTSLINTTSDINTLLLNLQNSGYWSRVPDDFSILTMYAIRFFETSLEELGGITKELGIEVQDNHISRINSLAKTAGKLSRDFGQTWNREYGPKDYGEPNFNNVEEIYRLGRGMAVDMVDLSNVAARLKDFLGMKSENNKQRNFKKYILPILLFLLGIIISIVTNVASSALPPSFQPYYWLSWPILAVLTVVSIILLVKQ